MTSAGTFPHRLTRIDDLTRPDHWYLTPDDACFFLGEYTARQGFAYSETNRLIINLKKPINRRGRPEWRYKEQAIQEAAVAFGNALGPIGFERLTFVPIPPSKAKDHPLYDDRLPRMLHAMTSDHRLDIRELILQTKSTEPVHGSDARPHPAEIEALYRIDESIAHPAPLVIALVDDLVTTGAHFRAACSVLSARFQASRLLGLFIARRAPNTADLEDFEGLDG